MEGLPVLDKKLPCYRPRDPSTGKRIGVKVQPAHKQRTKWESNMSLVARQVERCGMIHVFRELFQNFLDAIVEVNGGTFAGLTISRNEARTEVYFHTADIVYGVIRTVQSRVQFVNYGPVIDSASWGRPRSAPRTTKRDIMARG